MRLSYVVGAGIGAIATAAVVSAAPQIFKLSDHPDGNANPPPYGLRLDGIFNGLAGAGTNSTTTFSFNAFNNVYMVVDDSGSDLKITMSGTVEGGVDSGPSYGFGFGTFDFYYEMTVNVDPMGTGWLVSSPSNGVNRGRLVAVGGNGVAAGAVFNFYESNSMGNPFKFLQDEHRLAGHPQAGMGFWVGRGWHTTNSNGNPAGPTQDFLFLGSNIVPLPTAAGLGLGALLALPALRRRR